MKKGQIFFCKTLSSDQALRSGTHRLITFSFVQNNIEQNMTEFNLVLLDYDCFTQIIICYCLSYIYYAVVSGERLKSSCKRTYDRRKKCETIYYRRNRIHFRSLSKETTQFKIYCCKLQTIDYMIQYLWLEQDLYMPGCIHMHLFQLTKYSLCNAKIFMYCFMITVID